MFYILAIVLFAAGVTYISLVPTDVFFLIEGSLLMLLSIVYVKEGNTERRSRKIKAYR